MNPFKRVRYSNFNILARVLLSYCIFILLVYFLNRNNGRLNSFLVVNFSALVALAVLSFNLRKQFGFNVMQSVFIGYFIKLLIGYLFWKFYLFPDYFSNPISMFKFGHSEYLYTEYLMKTMAIERLAEGLLYFSPQTLLTKHMAIHYLMSNLYLSGSFNPFDLATQNILFSSYTALIILAISKRLGATHRQMKFALVIAIYQPVSMISTIIWRDVVGQFFIALGGYFTLMALNKKLRIAILLLLIGATSMLMLRSIYFFFPFLAYSINLIAKSKNKYNLLFIPVLIAVVQYLSSIFTITDGLETYGSQLTSLSLWIFLPLNIGRLFVGPFPWTQWFKFNDYTILQIADYFQSVITISLVILCIKGLRKKRLLTAPGYPGALLLLFLFIPFIFVALSTTDIHQLYMTTGVIFLIPSVILSTTYYDYNRLNLIVFFLFICANLIFLLLGLSGQGAGALFR